MTVAAAGLQGTDVWVVVVARVGNSAKSRLAGVLRAADRRRLALAMLSDVLAVCRLAHLTGTLAVVDTPLARAAAVRAGALALLEPRTGDMNAAVSRGVRAVQQRGAGTVLVLPGDVPLVSVADLDDLLAAARSAPRAVIVGASYDAQGTNALLLRPPDVIAPSFGPPSLQRHVQAGLSAGALTLVRSELGLALDVDTPNDLVQLSERQPGGKTAAALRSLSLERRLDRNL